MGSLDSPPVGSINRLLTSLSTASELFIWLRKRFRPSIRPSDPDTMTNTAIEAIASSSGKNWLKRYQNRSLVPFLSIRLLRTVPTVWAHRTSTCLTDRQTINRRTKFMGWSHKLKKLENSSIRTTRPFMHKNCIQLCGSTPGLTKQESPPMGGTVRNATPLIQQ